MSTSDGRLSAFAALVLTIRAVRKVVVEQRFCQRGAKSWLAAFALFCPLLCAAQSEIEFKEYSAGLPFAISAGPDGAMWFTNYRSIGRITSEGNVTNYNLPDQNRSANRITLGPDGALWFTEISPDAIGRLTTDGVFTEFPLPNPSSGVLGIAAGPDGALWFTEWSGGKIGRITTTGIITEYPLPRFASTNWIVAGPDGAMWFTEGNEVGGGGYIGRISTSGIITEYLLPPPVSDWAQWGFAGIAVGTDGNLWVTDFHHRVLRVTCNGDYVEYSIPGYPPLVSGPDSITAGPDGALWFALFPLNSIARITTTGVITQYPVPTANSQVTSITTGKDGSIWFAEHASGKIGRILLIDNTPPLITLSVNPRILWPPNGRLVPVVVSGMVQDVGSGVMAGSVDYAVTDEYGEIQSSGPMLIDAIGNYSLTVLLPASRKGSDTDGRHYYIRVSARDNAGNRALKWGNVLVPHDRR